MSRLLLAIAAILAAGMLMATMERNDPTAKHVRVAAEKKADVKPADQVWLRLPAACSASIAKCTAGRVCNPQGCDGP